MTLNFCPLSPAIADALSQLVGITTAGDMIRWLGAMAHAKRRELTAHPAEIVRLDLAWRAHESDEIGNARLVAADRARELLVDVIRTRQAGP
jgi:hypothetical protein